MKKLVILLCLLLAAGGGISAEEIIWGSMYGTGNFALGADAAYETGSPGIQFALYPEAEMILFKPVMGKTSFFDIGAAVKGRFGFGTVFSAGLGVSAALHLGFRGLDVPFVDEYLKQTDVFAEFGGKWDFITPSSNPGFVFKSGVNYFLTENFAVGAFYSRWGDFGGGGVSAFLKLGKTPEVEGISFEMPSKRKTAGLSGFAVQPYLLQFYTLFYSAHYAGGFYPDYFKEGQGVVHRVSVIDGDETVSYMVAKALLEELPDGERLWSLEYTDDDDIFYYEYITDGNYNVEKVYYEDEDEGVLEFSGDTAVNPEAEYLTWEDYEAEGRPGVEVTVEAGRFITTEYNYVDETGVEVKWWLTDEVPGQLVSYKMEDSSGIVISELTDKTSRNKARLYK